MAPAADTVRVPSGSCCFSVNSVGPNSPSRHDWGLCREGHKDSYAEVTHPGTAELCKLALHLWSTVCEGGSTSAAFRGTESEHPQCRHNVSLGLPALLSASCSNVLKVSHMPQSVGGETRSKRQACLPLPRHTQAVWTNAHLSPGRKTVVHPHYPGLQSTTLCLSHLQHWRNGRHSSRRTLPSSSIRV